MDAYKRQHTTFNYKGFFVSDDRKARLLELSSPSWFSELWPHERLEEKNSEGR